MSIMSDIMPTPRSVIAARSGDATANPRVEQANPSGFKEEAARAQQALSQQALSQQAPSQQAPSQQAPSQQAPSATNSTPHGNETASSEPSWYRQGASSGEADAHGFRDPNGEVGTFGLMDAIDVVNPLHHLPIIGGLYRELTGDEINPTARAAGGLLWGGPMGLLASVINSGVETETGKDIPGNVVAMLSGEQTLPDQNVPTDTGLGEQAPVLAQQGLDQGAQQNTGQRNAGQDAGAMTAEDAAAEGTLVFTGASASRLDAFIRTSGGRQNASPAAAEAWAIRESLKLDTNRSTPNPSLYPGAPSNAGTAAGSDRVMVSGPARSPGSVGDWMSQALDRYEVLRARKPT